MSKKKTIKDVNFKGKRVFCRVDFNVPIKNGVISDDTRITAALPTIKHIMKAGGRLILASHLGRPEGEYVKEDSLKPCADHLAKLLGKPVAFADDCVSPEALKAANALKDGDVLVLENVRFKKAETLKKTDDPAYVDFSKKLASMADIFVSDAFGTAHRAHASMVGVAQQLPVRVAGLLMEKEIDYLAGAISSPKRPMVVILGGKKVSDKIKVIENLLNIADSILIGGAMAYTFALAQGGKVGGSLVEPELVDTAKGFIETAKSKKKDLLLPVDTMVANEFSATAKTQVVASGAIPDGWQGLDIGPKTIKLYSDKIKGSKMVIWNGPMGVFELTPFAVGTNAIAEAIIGSGAVSTIGGGDSVSAIQKTGKADKITHISTGGGASLELLEGRKMPGIDVLDNA